jgi:hypothetical protein
MKTLQSKPGIRGRLVMVGVAWGALAGCCLSSISGFGTAGPGTSGSGFSGGRSASSATSSTGAASVGASSSGTGSGAGNVGSSSGGTSSGTTTSGTGTSGTTTGLTPVDTIFGPVAIAAVPAPSDLGAARLVYSKGDGGQFGIMLQSLAGDGGPLGDPLQVATTGVWWGSADGGEPSILYPVAPPNVTVADDGSQIAICWEDYGPAWSAVASSACDPTGDQAVVRCVSVPEGGGIPDASYANCGHAPSLVFNPVRGDTQLFFAGAGSSVSPLEEWAYGQGAEVSQELSTMSATRPTGVSLASGEGVVYTEINDNWGPQLGELFLATSGYADGAYLDDGSTVVDPAYTSFQLEGCGKVPTPFVAASNLADTIEVLEWQQEPGCETPPQLLQFIWQVDAGVGEAPTEIQSTVPLLGAIAVGVCPDGFENFMTTAFGTVFVARVDFDGGASAAPSYLTLPGFNQTPGLNRVDNTGFSEPATSLAVALAPGGKLFLAISNPWQVGVYVVDCE